MTAPLMNVVLGILITLSGYCFNRSPTSATFICAVAGPLITFSSVVALRLRRATYVTALTGFLLLAESMISQRTSHSLLLLLDMAMGLLVIGVALAPNPKIWMPELNSPSDFPESLPTPTGR